MLPRHFVIDFRANKSKPPERVITTDQSWMFALGGVSPRHLYSTTSITSFRSSSSRPSTSSRSSSRSKRVKRSIVFGDIIKFAWTHICYDRPTSESMNTTCMVEITETSTFTNYIQVKKEDELVDREKKIEKFLYFLERRGYKIENK